MRGRDPRIDPKVGDILDDDPPLPPLRVVSRLGLSVYGLRTHPRGPIPWQGTLLQWRAEMSDSFIVRRAT